MDERAKLACTESNRTLHFLQPATPGWETRASGVLEQRRRHQSVEWMHAMIEEELCHRFLRNERVRALLPEIEKQVAGQTLPAATAVKSIMEEFSKDG